MRVCLSDLLMQGGEWTKGTSCCALTSITGFKPRPHSPGPFPVTAHGRNTKAGPFLKDTGLLWRVPLARGLPLGLANLLGTVLRSKMFPLSFTRSSNELMACLCFPQLPISPQGHVNSILLLNKNFDRWKLIGNSSHSRAQIKMSLREDSLGILWIFWISC